MGPECVRELQRSRRHPLVHGSSPMSGLLLMIGIARVETHIRLASVVVRRRNQAQASRWGRVVIRARAAIGAAPAAGVWPIVPKPSALVDGAAVCQPIVASCKAKVIGANEKPAVWRSIATSSGARGASLRHDHVAGGPTWPVCATFATSRMRHLHPRSHRSCSKPPMHQARPRGAGPVADLAPLPPPTSSRAVRRCPAPT